MRNEIKKKVLKRLEQPILLKSDVIIFDLTIEETAKQIFGFGERAWNNTETYRMVLRHRDKCPKWTKEFCLKCFGGGLTLFTENLKAELKKKWVK